MNWRRLTITVAVVLVAIWLGVAFLTDPLEHGSFRGYPGFETVRTNDPFSGAVGLIYDHGYEGLIILSMRNAGPVPVTVRDISVFPSGDTHLSLLRQEGVVIDLESMLTDRAIGVVDGLRLPDSSLTIGPGREHEVGVEVRFTECEWYAVGMTQGFDWMRVDYTILAIPRTVEVPIDRIWVTSPEDCPTR